MSKGEYPTTRDILCLLGIGALLAGSIIMPGLGVAAGSIVRAKRKHDFEQSQKTWKRFNFDYLKRNLKRLHYQKLVEIIETDGQQIVKLTQKGRTKFLRFRLEDLSLKRKFWDGKWRLVIYDISRIKKSSRESFRRILKRMNFLQLQESVYLTPYKCNQEIDYMREYFNLGEEVIFMEVSKLENETLYREYFGVK